MIWIYLLYLVHPIVDEPISGMTVHDMRLNISETAGIDWSGLPADDEEGPWEVRK